MMRFSYVDGQKEKIVSLPKLGQPEGEIVNEYAPFQLDRCPKCGKENQTFLIPKNEFLASAKESPIKVFTCSCGFEVEVWASSDAALGVK